MFLECRFVVINIYKNASRQGKIEGEAHLFKKCYFPPQEFLFQVKMH